MATTRRVIRSSCLPTRMPSGFLIAFGLLLDRFDIPGWAWGVYGCFALLLVIGVLMAWHQEDERELPGFGRNE